ncbi:MAG: anaerobic ribonucleoside-triphosphate reductase activating protein [Tidjanibacter sp.]|nr:anaerobic ribonucleoside-triphosphate reductase activating protein [Tidjanibacter sp.]
MLKIYNYDIVAQEIPDELTLALNLSCCPLRCEGCHSPWLQTDAGEVLTPELLGSIVERYLSAATCLCFMGGDGDRKEVVRMAKSVRVQWPKLRIGWYTGSLSVPRQLEQWFDYVKTGAYVASLGGLKSPDTNQRLYAVDPDGRRTILLPQELSGRLL